MAQPVSINTNATDNKNDNDNDNDNKNNSSSLTPSHQPLSPSTTFTLKEKLKDKCFLFYCPSMESIAKEIYNKSPDKIILGDIQWQNFADGFPNLKVNSAYNCRWAHVAFLADLSNPKNIFEQYAVMCALPRFLSKSVKIFVGYFPTGTMERVEEYGRIATAKTLARLLSSIPIGTHGPAQICICDLHTLQNLFYFSDNVLVRLESGIPLIKQELKLLSDVSVAFPDAGACKRFGKFFKKYPQIICEKVRDGNKRSVRITQGNPENRTVVIIDDLVQTGGTLAECGTIIKKGNCKSVSCYCTHSVFPKDSWKRFCNGGKNDGLFKTFYITDTIPTVSNLLSKHQPFKVLKTSSIFSSVILEDDDVNTFEH